MRNLALREQGRNAEWTHPAIYWAAMDVGPFDMRTAGYPQLRSRWEKALDAQMREREIKPVPPAPQALPAPDLKPMPPEIKAKLAELTNHIRMKKG